MKRAFALLLTIVMILSIIPFDALTVHAASGNATNFAGGSGTAEDPYLISTKEHLNNVRSLSTYASSVHFKMINDIEFTDADFADGGDFYNDGLGWEPIGTLSKPFRWTFDGANYTIRNIKITRESDCVGLFGCLENAQIQNVRLENPYITGENCVGGICGYIESVGDHTVDNTTIDNCFVFNATVRGKSNVGGISGYFGYNSWWNDTEATINMCYVDGQIEASENYASGVCGAVGDVLADRIGYEELIVSGMHSTYSITNCYNNAAVSSPGCAAGILAHSARFSYSKPFGIYGCVNSGNIQAGEMAGGVIAYIDSLCIGVLENGIYYKYYYWSPTISNCLNSGMVHGETYAGGIAGQSPETTSPTHIYGGLTSSYNVGEVTGNIASSLIADAGSYPITSCYDLKNDLTNQSTFEGWDFDTIWTMEGDKEYPYPELQCFVLSGEVAIDGNFAYKETVIPDASALTGNPSNYTYTWYVDDVEVGASPTYNIKADDIGKVLTVKITCSDIMRVGSVISSAYMIGKAVQTAVAIVPTLLHLDSNSFEINTVSTQEYSIDNINWQSSGIFENLDPNKAYTVYSRILENDLYLLGESTAVLTVTTPKNTISAPAAPAVESATDISVTLVPISGYEYSKDGIVWQKGNVFSGLEALETYTFYQRVAETETDYASAASEGTSFTVKFIASMPAAPVLSEATNDRIVVETNEGYQYSIDGINWRKQGIFTGLTPNTEYTVYCRMMENDLYYTSQSSSPLYVTTSKNTVDVPGGPVLSAKTANSVTLLAKAGYEYSKDGTSWQESNVFSGLKPNTTYTFYQRIAETETDYASDASVGMSVTTYKNTADTPEAPVLTQVTSNSVTLAAGEGYEYSKDGITWQTSNVFSGLKPNTKYSFYQRAAETESDYVSESSSALLVTTLKNNTSTPTTPSVISKTDTSVALKATSGYEYSKDGVNWQSSNVFSALNANTQYTFYQRVAETETAYASAASEGIKVTTLKRCEANPDFHTYDNDCDASCNECGAIRTPGAHEYDNACDASCNECGATRTPSAHEYDNDCDATCNICQDIRAVPDHVYDNDCDTICNVCQNVRTVPDHVFDNTCDTECNICKHIRTTEHTYDNACDTVCNICQSVRSVPDHSYTLNGNHTCDICKYSKTPNAPTVGSRTNNSVVLASVDGLEYSKDGINWQSSNVFTDLAADATYTFYQRVAASEIALVSEASQGTSVTFKPAQAAPSAPIILSYTDTTVTLFEIANGEYSTDGITWQTSNVFTGLSAATNYTFYQRYAETVAYEASNSSLGVSITTDKAKQTSIPNAPMIESFTSSTITLVAVDGCEYSKNGTTWQSSNVFSGLSCVTEYTFYQRYQETTTTYAGKSSEGLIAKTDKGVQSQPAAPTLSSKTYNSVTLYAISGYEYSRDGINWQKSNEFTGLDAETNYLFFQRIAETDTHYASDTSAMLAVRTDEVPACVADPALHSYTSTCDTTCNACGATRSITHTWDNACDTSCNICGETRSTTHTWDNACDTLCNTCGASRVITHNYVMVTTKATLAENGTMVETCDICGATGAITTIPCVNTFRLPGHIMIADGTLKKPVPIVMDAQENTLIEGVDYIVTYPSNAIEAGDYELFVTLIGNYSGEKILHFIIEPAIEITKQPTTQKVKAGATVELSLDTIGFGVEYQWQSSTNGTSWKNCSSSSATKATFSFTSKTSHNGNYYRCKITDGAGNVVYTSAVRLYVLGVTTQPKTQTVKSGATVKFTVKATGTGLKYQWQSSTNGKTWKNCSSISATKATFSFTSKTSHNGNYYRCKVTDSAGNVVYTSSVRAYVLGVTTQPKTQKLEAGDKIKLTVGATGDGLKYQWQSSSNGKTWKNCSSSSAKKATFSFTSKTSHNGNYYRCKITDSSGNVVYTSAVRAYVLGVTTQPKTQKVESGDKIKLTVKATGDGLKYQWQSSSNGKTWKNCTSSSAKKATFSFTTKTSHSGNYYRCKVTDSAGNVVYTSMARAYVLGIKDQPDSKTVTKGKTAKFTVETTGHSVKYQWQVSTDGGKTWKNSTSSSAKKATFSFTTKTSHNGNYYRCKITDSAKNSMYTNKVKLTVKK